MKTFNSEYRFDTDGDGTIVDLTSPVGEAVSSSGISSGQIVVSVPGSTAAVTTIEYEPGLLGDLPELFEKLVPSGREYGHDAAWGDGNGFSHLRAALVGPSVSLPVHEGRPVLGTWQQIVFLEFDNRPRARRVHISIVGE